MGRAEVGLSGAGAPDSAASGTGTAGGIAAGTGATTETGGLAPGGSATCSRWSRLGGGGGGSSATRSAGQSQITDVAMMAANAKPLNQVPGDRRRRATSAVEGGAMGVGAMVGSAAAGPGNSARRSRKQIPATSSTIAGVIGRSDCKRANNRTASHNLTIARGTPWL